MAITGTLTNVCCESSARDALMRNFKVIMVPDGNATYNDVLHNASLTSLSIAFADLMTADEVIKALVQPGESPSPVPNVVSLLKARESPPPNWRGNCGTQY